MPILRELKMGDEQKLIPLFKILTGREVLIDTVSLIADKNSTCLVFEDGENLAGFGSLVIHHVPTEGEVAMIEDIVIGENYQKQGLGKQLVLKLIEIAKEKNINKINLTSNPMRIGARKLYESVGFTKINTDTFLMSL